MKKTLLYPLLLIGLVFTLTACASSSASTTVVVIPIIGTAIVGTGESISLTSLPPDSTVPATVVPSAPTPIPPIPGGLGPSELKYRLLAQFPDFFFCDPDYYPVASADEMDRARQLFPELQADKEEFNAILAHNNLAGLTTFSDDQKLLIYRQHKKLAAIQFTLTSAGYQFQLQVAKTQGGGERIAGLIDGQGTITDQQTTPSIATCPICLATGTRIDTPAGAVPVQDLRLGMPVWTLDKTGARIAQPLVRVSRTIVPANHQVVHLVLDDGRALWVSPGHPTPDGRRVGQLQVGDSLDGARVLSVDRVPYAAPATYDLLPAGDTGFYWANGFLLASTLSDLPK
jgi:Hint domain